MTLGTCSECNGQVASTAAVCPHCGNPFTPSGVVAKSTNSETTRELTKPSAVVRPGGILLGLLLLGAGLYAALVFIPEHDVNALGVDLHSLQRLVREDKFIRHDLVPTYQVAAWVFVCAGAVQLLTGSIRRTGIVAWCDACKRQVIGRRAIGGWACVECKRRVHA